MKATDYKELTGRYDHFFARPPKMIHQSSGYRSSLHCMNTDSRSPGGFTLVELIVVVAVIAILISLLVPVLGRARSEAETVKCRANLKSLGLALNLYAQNNNQDYPVAERCHNPHLDLLELTAGYVNPPELFYCPANTEPDQTYTPANVAAGNISYFYFCAEKRPTNLDTAAFLQRSVPWPRHLSTNSSPGTWLACDIWYSGLPTAHRWYKRAVNYLTTDQAVGFVPESIRSTFK